MTHRRNANGPYYGWYDEDFHYDQQAPLNEEQRGFATVNQQGRPNGNQNQSGFPKFGQGYGQGHSQGHAQGSGLGHNHGRGVESQQRRESGNGSAPFTRNDFGRPNPSRINGFDPGRQARGLSPDQFANWPGLSQQDDPGPRHYRDEIAQALRQVHEGAPQSPEPGPFQDYRPGARFEQVDYSLLQPENVQSDETQRPRSYQRTNSSATYVESPVTPDAAQAFWLQKNHQIQRQAHVVDTVMQPAGPGEMYPSFEVKQDDVTPSFPLSVDEETRNGGEDLNVVRANAGEKRQAHKFDNEELRRASIGTYFGRRPTWTPIAIAGGLGFMFHPWRYDSLYGFQLSFDLAFGVGCLALLLGLAFRFFFLTLPSDDQVDEWTVKELRNLEEAALDQMDLKQSELMTDPIVFTGFADIDKISHGFRASRYGDDHVLRHSPRALTVLAFREHDVLAFESAIDLVTGQRVYESMRSFFYRDVTTVGTARLGVKRDFRSYSKLLRLLLPWRWAFVERLVKLLSARAISGAVNRKTKDVFVIGLADGQNIVSVLRDGRMGGERDHEEIPVVMENDVVQLIRELVRVKKSEQLGMPVKIEQPEFALP